jgi:hypothetical protein
MHAIAIMCETFEGFGLEKPDSSQMMMQLELQGVKRYFTRNLLQCWIYDLAEAYKDQACWKLGRDHVVTKNGRQVLRLPGQVSSGGAMGVDGDAIVGEGGVI